MSCRSSTRLLPRRVYLLLYVLYAAAYLIGLLSIVLDEWVK